MIKTGLKYFGVALLFPIGIFFVGPKPSFEKFDNHPIEKSFDIASLDKIIADREGVIQYLKEDNEARIVWADSIRSKTEYSIVYLHGFSASQGEGFPMHLNLADSLGANLYLPRLPEHGIDNLEAMKDLTPKLMVDAAKDAIAIGKSIGEKVIVMGCSTGGTLAIFIAEGDPNIEALILLSPNIEVKTGATKLLTGPWGRELAYSLAGKHRVQSPNEDTKKYWSYQYHTNGLIAMQSLLDLTMIDHVFKNLKLPIYCGYFYKDEEVQDPVVSVGAILEFKEALNIPIDDLEFEAFGNGNHVLGSIYKNDNWKDVQDEVWDFIKREIL